MMRLNCHAKKRNGEMCMATACAVAYGHPVCGRTPHYFGDCEFFPVTAESVRPSSLEQAQAYIHFKGGLSIQRLSEKMNLSYSRVEALIREAMI